MSITRQYSSSYQFVRNPPGAQGHTIARPWAEVVLRNGGQQHRTWCVVDTGADFTLMSRGAAGLIGINPDTLLPLPVNTASGKTTHRLARNLTLEIAGVSIKADVLFGMISVPLLGRPAMLAAMEVGFDATHWHHV